MTGTTLSTAICMGLLTVWPRFEALDVELGQALMQALETGGGSEDIMDQVASAHQAYIYAYPLAEVYRTREGNMKAGYKVNALRRADVTEVNCNFTEVIAPNVDTAYTSSFIDVSTNPMVLTVPNFPSDYYWMVQIMDAFTDSFAYAGATMTDVGKRTFVLTGPKFPRTVFCGEKQAKPYLCGDSVTLFHSTSNLIWMIGRYLNSPKVSEYQAQTLLTPFGEYDPDDVKDSKCVLPDYPPYKDDKVDDYFATLNVAMQEFENLTERPQDSGMLAALARVGVGTKESLSMVSSHEVPTLSDVSLALSLGRRSAAKAIEDSQEKLTTHINGWAVPPKSCSGDFGNDYLCRANVARFSLGRNRMDVAVYPSARQDSEGRSMDGSSLSYRIDFDSPPPIKSVGFWSITVYSPEGRLTCNDYSAGDARYSINSNTDLVIASDGSFTIYLAHARPDDDKKYKNWLPVPHGAFYVTMRVYNPSPDYESFSLPAIQAIDNKAVYV